MRLAHHGQNRLLGLETYIAYTSGYDYSWGYPLTADVGISGTSKAVGVTVPLQAVVTDSSGYVKSNVQTGSITTVTGMLAATS